ncbi:small ribosomal subunit Rsm22 family protein [Chloroflexus sp.]|uniref:small ribosomal subunit Rsm22 family protein n=1 Tax=Chloroflexus sp. TaxID=1904827 RepID=UPI00261B3178|nr:small ribosomal subunit Rsm22 family protein [uncultured Chloroflexus sp.]
MQLPATLQRALERMIASQASATLEQAAATLSNRYRTAEAGQAPAIASPLQAIAYAAWRMPATYAALRAAFRRLAEAQPDFIPSRMLDIGAGSGAAIWAAAEQWPSLRRIVAIERQPAMARIGEQLTAGADLPTITWQRSDVLSLDRLPESDLVVAGYVFGEIEPSARAILLSRLWKATTGALVLVEPGTPSGHATILNLRSELIKREAILLAPCPHTADCPLAARGDWCHFAQRIARPAFLRRLKGAAAPFEDEKFAYLIAARRGQPLTGGRITRHPIIHSGRIELQVCTAQGLQQITVTRSQGEAWRRARDSGWGDGWDSYPSLDRGNSEGK